MSETRGAQGTTELLKVRVQIMSHADLSAASHALSNIADKETDKERADALERVSVALFDITNWYGIEAIGCDSIVGDHKYLPREKAPDEETP